MGTVEVFCAGKILAYITDTFIENNGGICYNASMKKKKDIYEFIKKRKYFFWYVPEDELKNLKDESIVEHTLNYGNWDDVQELISILGMERTAAIFREKSKKSKMGRTNYDSKTIYYFNLYFNKYAPGNSHRKTKEFAAISRKV